MKKFLFYAITILTLTPFIATAMDEDKQPFLLRTVLNKTGKHIALSIRTDSPFTPVDDYKLCRENPETFNRCCRALAVYTAAGHVRIDYSITSLPQGLRFAKTASFCFWELQKAPIYTFLSESSSQSTLPIDIEIDKEGIVKVFTEQRKKDKE